MFWIIIYFYIFSSLIKIILLCAFAVFLFQFDYNFYYWLQLLFSVWLQLLFRKLPRQLSEFSCTFFFFWFLVFTSFGFSFYFSFFQLLKTFNSFNFSSQLQHCCLHCQQSLNACFDMPVTVSEVWGHITACDYSYDICLMKNQ